MTQKAWFALVVVASISAAGAISFAPRLGLARFSEVQQCGKPTHPVHPPRGHVACSLKNGNVIFLRRAK